MPQLKVFTFNPLQVNTYLFFEPEGPGILIDASCMNLAEFTALDSYIRNNQIQLEYLLNTHGHFDHVFGVQRVIEAFHPRFFIHQADERLLQMAGIQAGAFGFDFDSGALVPDGYLHDGDKIDAGTIHLEVIHVPGHSPGGIALYEAEMGLLFSGDTLFAGGIGRTDLPGGDYHQLINSIRNRLLVLPAETRVYPGHGIASTIGLEKENNPFL